MSLNMSGSDDHEVQWVTEEEVDNKKYGTGEPVVEINSPENNKLKRKSYHRHTPHQIQAMEEDCPHPDNKQRIELSQELGMDPLQVKFWFQNKRSQMKTKHERQQNTNLRADNEKLRVENRRFREALSSASCPACGRNMASIGGVWSLDERHLRMENARLRDEIDRISGVASNYVGKRLTNSSATPSSYVPCSTNLGTSPMFTGSSSKGKGSNDFDDASENNTP